MQSPFVQCNHHLVALPYLKLPLELRSSRLILQLYRQPLTRHNGVMHQTAFIKVSLEADSYSFKVAGLPTMVRNSLSPTVYLNHMAIHKCLINADLYLTFSKDNHKLLVVKSLMNNLKFKYFNIVFYSFFSQIFVV